MQSLKVIGKYLDQPLLVAKFANAVPKILVAGGIGCVAHDYFHSSDKKKTKSAIKNTCVLTGTIGSALFATRGMKPLKIGKFVFKGFEGLSDNKSISEIRKSQTKLINDFMAKHSTSGQFKNILSKAKDTVLKPEEIKKLQVELEKTSAGKDLYGKLIPNPETVTSKEIFGEIKRLSLMGLVPVVGGIAGGIVGDKLTEKKWKEKIPNKIKEGSYQYLANIFLCNVGAGAALGILEKMKVKSKAARVAGMVSGIILTGVVGGSVIANYISKYCIDPFIKNKCSNSSAKKLYQERKPEALDIGLHVDDIATVAVMSGLSWIEPALPILYSVSGYRAGIGYRNGDMSSQKCHEHLKHHQSKKLYA